jgi:hypothetical protein
MRPFGGSSGKVPANYSNFNDSECEFNSKPCIEVMCGAVLSRLRVFSEEQWMKLEDHERPVEAVYADGLGWVSAVACHVMN